MAASTKRRLQGKSIKELAALSNPIEREKPVEPHPIIEHDDPVWAPAPYTVFKVFMSARLCAAAWNIVGDCDETFNYWEPTHYLMFGKGFQTWEYSPEYAIRSYAYLMLHTLPMRLYGLIFTPNPVMMFFFTRCILALACALTEVVFYKGVCRQFGNNVGRIIVCFQLIGAGFFISSTAYLPSSFCMYMTFLSIGAWFLGKYEVAIMATAASAIVGWPFAAIIGVPIAFDILFLQRKVVLFMMWVGIALVTFLLPLVQIDQYYYGKLVVAPLNIVMYNVFTEHGPDLYGVEPFSYYIINGLLNFNIVFPLALVSAPFVILSNYILKVKTQGIPIWLSLAGMYIWAAIFFTRPHKEERFLFPIYPLIAVAGAVSVDYIQLWWRCVFVRSKGGHYVDHTSWISVFVGIFFTLMSVSRIVAVYQAYHAPLDLYVELNKLANDEKVHTLSADRPVTLCVGKEWYRYPSSFFLPGQNWNLHYLKSEFEGQLPKPYDSGPDATRIIPSNMNDMNKEEPSRYVNVSKCHYLVDLDLPRETTHEPRYSQKTEEWTTLVSIPFLDASRSHRVFRAFYIPFVSSRYCVYENYNLLKTTRTKKTNRSQKHTR
ncbi:alpha-1,2-mannosyltransferase ALG9-like [Mya arenaria]|uniref:alpha-1,2-mannosyltransferase ALG9-like n=1 Tax=Mya arenaria TaxID=6604 RepID=UPI0022E66CFD|nr:alpha-1,2-mannosyltransferase ALG9-like [Mya arenaria]